jgi:Uma2 family endonuclease
MVAQVDKPQQKLHFTPEEYLELEEQSVIRHEYRDGEIIEMTGGTTEHNKISLNFCRRFPLSISDRDYEIYMNDVRLWIDAQRIYTYPDVMVVQGQPIYEGKSKAMIVNPLIILEVLSDSTQSYDRTEKFRYYRSISSFREYLLVDQYNYYVEKFFKTEDQQWIYEAYEGEEAVIRLNAVEFQITCHDLYDRVRFADE